jgi:hypothetical protein
MLGWAWSRLPIGDVGYRMNLFSALNGALTIALAERILRRLRVGPWATFGALGLLAGSTYFWGLSLIAEVYTLHTALMAGLILLLLHWADRPTPSRLALAGLLAGLSLGHHAATVLLIPGCVWYVATAHPHPRRALAPRALLPALGTLLVGLSVYLYLPLRYGADPAFNYAGHYDASGTFIPINLRTPEGLWWLVSGRAFAGQMWFYSGADLWQEIALFSQQLWRAFFAIGIGPGLLGLAVLLRRDRRLGGMLLFTFLANAAFYIDYRAGDKATMFLPAYLVWALWVGVGYGWLIDWVRGADDAQARRWGVGLLRVAMVGAVLFVAAWNWPLVDLSDDWSARERGEEILDQLPSGALVVGWWDTVPVIQYLQLVEGRRPDVQAINRFTIGYDEVFRLVEREAGRRPVYMDRMPAELLEIVDVEPAGELFRVRPRE